MDTTKSTAEPLPALPFEVSTGAVGSWLQLVLMLMLIEIHKHIHISWHALDGVLGLFAQATLSGSFEPSFRVPLDFGYGEVSKLPLSVFGAVAMAHDADDANSAKSKFFLFRYDR